MPLRVPSGTSPLPSQFWIWSSVMPHSIRVKGSVITAGGVHATKTAVRPAVTVSTGGVGNPVVSAVEDAVSLGVSLLALLAPVLLAVVLLVAVVLLLRWWRRRRTPAEAG